MEITKAKVNENGQTIFLLRLVITMASKIGCFYLHFEQYIVKLRLNT